jgi:protein-tyrosine phosphatase
LRFSNTHSPMNADHQRVLPFRRIANFRDLGGYPAANGKRVKWGLLYRSGHFAKASPADLIYLQALNIDTIIDFRSAQEKEQEPDRLPASGGMKILALPMLDVVNEAMSKEIHTAVKNNDFQDFDPFEKMLQMYQVIAREHAAKYRLFIQTIQAAQGRPVLWHCTAGKDRTGFGAAILLRLLGVEDQVIIKDYLLSRQYIENRRRLMLMLRLTRGREVVGIVKKLMSVDETWMQAAFQALDQQWGNFENYAKEGLALSPADIAQLRTTLLDGAR